jgi:hypothetical protein
MTDHSYCRYDGTYAVYFSHYHGAWVVEYECISEEGEVLYKSRRLIYVETLS